MIELELADLVLIASRTLSLDTGQVLDLLDPAAAEQALALAQPGDGGRGDGDLARQAAALLHALVRQRPMRRGNLQVALAATLQFLALNGWDLDPDPPGPIASTIAQLAAGTLDAQSTADRLKPRLRPAGLAATCVKEAPMRARPALPLANRIAKVAVRTPSRGVSRRLTDRARRAVHLAEEEARLLRHNYIGTEHLLLAMLDEDAGVATQVLASLGISRQAVQDQVDEIIGRGQGAAPAPVPFTPRAKRVLALSLREALALGHHYIGTEHILLAVLSEGQGVGAQVLTRLGADYATARERGLGLLTGACPAPGPQAQLAADLVGATVRLSEVRRQKEAALDSGDVETAAELRDLEKQLRADRLRLEHQLTAGADIPAVIAENRELRGELERLRDLLHQHGIEVGRPESDGGTTRTA